jgi:hypothetical protein
VRCGIGASCALWNRRLGGQCLSIGDYVAMPGPPDEATAAGGPLMLASLLIIRWGPDFYSVEESVCDAYRLVLNDQQPLRHRVIRRRPSRSPRETFGVPARSGGTLALLHRRSAA